MIEPLRFNKEVAFAHEINRPAFCNSCLSQKQSRMNPNIAIKYCAECPATLGHQKDFGAFLCKACDDSIHDKGLPKFHLRQILVVGPGVRKRVIVRGDTCNFPCPLDQVKIKLRSRIYHGGKRIHKEPARYITFISGTSGKTLHVQVLGARNLVAGDIGGMSDPFVVYSFCGKTLGSTRVRPRSLNPRWDNETFIVPMEENLPPPRGVVPSQKDLFKLEVYDYDWFSSNEFLGHLEIAKSKLMKMAVVANQQPIRLPLTTKEYHGSASIRVGFNKDQFFVRVLRAESLDKQDAILLSNPYAKIFMGFDNALIGTTSVMANTTHPEWGDVSSSANEFRVRIEQLLLTEKRIRSNIAINRNARDNESSSRSNNAFSECAEHLSLLRIEVFSQRRFGKDILLGKCSVSCDDLRQMLPSLPSGDAYDLDQFQQQQQRGILYVATAVATQAGTFEMISGLVTVVNRRLFRWFCAPRSRFAHSHVKMRTEDDESSRQGEGQAGMAEEDQEDDETAFGPPPDPADESDIERASRSSGRSAHLGRGVSVSNIPALARRALSTKNLLSVLSLSAPRDTAPLVTTWSGIYPVNVLKDSAKTMAASAAASLGLGMVNGQLILRLIPSSRGSVVVGLDDAVRQMSLGEKANVKCRYDYAYNNYCMGSNIPPRANIVFTVELLEINGQGRFGVPWRMFKRLMRILVRLVKWLTTLLLRLTSRDASVALETGPGSKSHKKKKSRKSGRHGGGDSDSEEDSSDSDSQDDDEEGDEGELLVGGSQTDDQMPAQHDANNRRVKADPRMRKHMTQSVRSGSQLMWGYKPPPPPPPSATVQRRPKQLSRESSERPLAQENEEEKEGEEQFEGGDEEEEDGSGSDQDEEDGEQ